MNIGAIFNAFDGIELLRGSMSTVKADHYIIVWQDISNFGERYNPLPEIEEAVKDFSNVHLIHYHPEVTKGYKTGMVNEARKRNAGIQRAIQLGCSHFLILDVDEYHPDFEAAKQAYIDSGKDGSVLPMWTYFKSPTLRLERPENYYVPFIHKLTKDTRVGNFEYPYRVDHTRAVNTKSVALLTQYMHHYSWVRKDITLKARNSSARHLSQHLEDYQNAKAGMYIGCYAQKLIEVENACNVNIF